MITESVHLPIITKVRELDSRLVQTISLTRQGYTVIVGETSKVTDHAFASPPGIYMTPILVPMAARRLQSLRRRGYLLIGWDEEGLVYPEARWYVEDRLDSQSVAKLDLLITWGSEPRRDVLAVRPRPGTPIRALGNPRIDMLRDPLRQIHAEEGRSHRERLGPYVLVNTNFDLVNHADGNDGFLDRLRRSGRVTDEQDEMRFRDWAAFRRTIFDAFVEGVPQLASAFPDLTFVLRPHPSESVCCYEQLEARYANILVAPPRGTVIPWIEGAEAVLHNSCTTAVEAYVLGTPVIAYRPDALSANMESALPNELSRCGSNWDEVAALLRDLRKPEPAEQIRRREVASRWMANLGGPLAADRIAVATRSLDERLTTSARREASRRWRCSLPAATIRRVRGREALPSVSTQATADSRQRFPGLDVTEVEQRIAQFCEHLHVPLPMVDAIGEHLFSISPSS